MKVSLKEMARVAANVKSSIDDIQNSLPDNQDAEDLANNFDKLWTMLLDISETLDCVLSDIEK
jgi:hypothetical protein